MSADQYYADVSLLLHCDGTNGATTFPDRAPTPKTVTAVGNAQVDTAQSLFGGASAKFDGTGDYLSVANHTDLDFGSGDFEIEMAVRLGTTTGNHQLIGKYDGAATGPFALYQIGSQIGFYAASVNTSWNLVNNLSFGSSFATGTWYRLGVSRSGNVYRTFLNGTLVSNTTVSGTIVSNTGPVTIGSAASGGGDDFNGWMDEIRLTKGQARHTATYSVDTAAFADTVPLTASSFSVTTFGTPVAPHFATSMGTVVTFGVPSTPLPATSLGNVVTFGTPTAFLRQVASSIGSVVTFGTPRLKNIARSWTVVTFGTPSTPLPATSLGNVVTFGTPRQQRRIGASSIGNVVTFGTPTSPTNRTCRASSWIATLFNTPVSIGTNPQVLDRTMPAVSLHPVTFGHPTAASSATVAASSWSPVTFGTPTSRITPRCDASSLGVIVSFGTPAALTRAHAHAWSPVTFGTPTSRRVFTASSITNRTHFGTPTYRRSNSHNAYSWMVTRFGQPTARAGMFRQATSLGSVVTFGTPTSMQRHRVLPSRSPVVTFGTPLAVRNPRC